MANIKEAFEYAAQNPDSDFAKNLDTLARSGALNTEAKKFGIDMSAFKPEPLVQSERNLAQKVGGFVGDSVAKLGTETGNLLGKGVVRVVQQFQTPEERAITEAKLQQALNTPSRVPGLGTDVKGLNQVTSRDVAGQALETVAMFAPGAGKAASLPTKVATGATTGYAFDVGTDLQNQDKTLGQAFTPGAATIVGGASPIVSKGLQSLSEKLPSWFVQKALPKLDPKNTDFALKNLDAASIKTNLAKSQQAVQSSGEAINSILSNPQYADEVGNVASVVTNVNASLPNSGLTDKKVINIIKQLAPKNSKLVDKLANGTITIAEQNTLRQELDRAIYPSLADKIQPKLTFNKSVGRIVTDGLRNNVQTTAPETAPLFEQFSKEIDLNKALMFAKSKIEKGSPVSMYDIGAAIAGGAPAIVGERAARTPSVLIGAAKGLEGLNKSKTLPVLGGVAKKGLLKGLSNSQ